MDKAYDSILQTIVSAADADPTDQFRYTCLCCKELVSVASPEQRVQVVHFRHHHGNNGTAECENYKPQPGQSVVGLQPQRDNVAFYYDNAKKFFAISLSLNEEEIQQCGQGRVCFELRSSYADSPFYRCPIDFLHFSAGRPILIPISQYSWTYCCSFSADGKKRHYSLFKKGRPTFFKVLGDADADFTAKQVSSGCLYTEITYFVVFVGDRVLPNFPASIKIMEQIRFQTLGKHFVGFLLQFTGKDVDTDYYLNQMGYHLETAESLSVIWPPMPQIDERYISDSESIFVLSSFCLRAKGNTNAEEREIMSIGGGISRISRSGEIRIHYKNADTTVQMETASPIEFRPLCVEEDSKNRFTVPDGQGIYVLHQKGTHLLKSGQEATLSEGDSVALYWHTYILQRIHFQADVFLSGTDLLDDILRNYKAHIPFSIAQFEGLELSPVAEEYLSVCEETGIINRAAAELIERGVI